VYRRTLLISSCVLPLLAACQSVDVQQTTTINAVVETVDATSRELLLRGNAGAQSGALLSVIAGPQVQNLALLRSGDRVKVVYEQALAAKMVNVLSPSSQPFEESSINRTVTADLRPGADLKRVRRGRVVITAVDPTANTVSFVGPNKVVRTVKPENAEVQGFIRGLHVGDQVDIVYEEALAISVEPMR